MTVEEIILIAICIIICIVDFCFVGYAIYLLSKMPTNKPKGGKMKKNANLEKQEQMIKELKDKVEYLELKENGAEIIWGQYTLVRYAYDGEIKEITLGGQMECYKKEKETEQYIILREISQIITDYSTGKWKQVTTFHIIDKLTGKMYDAQELNEELERYNEMKKALNEVIEQNEEKGE